MGNYGALYNKKGNRYAQENNLNTNFNDFGLSIELIGGPNEAYPVGPDEINGIEPVLNEDQAVAP